MENLNRFYEWMSAMGNIHMASNEKMSKAYEAIIASDAQVAKLPTQITLEKYEEVKASISEAFRQEGQALEFEVKLK